MGTGPGAGQGLPRRWRGQRERIRAPERRRRSEPRRRRCGRPRRARDVHAQPVGREIRPGRGGMVVRGTGTPRPAGGRIRREGMGKRVNFCTRSVVTCDSRIDVDEILIPHNVAARLTYPVSVHAYNLPRPRNLMLLCWGYGTDPGGPDGANASRPGALPATSAPKAASDAIHQPRGGDELRAGRGRLSDPAREQVPVPPAAAARPGGRAAAGATAGDDAAVLRGLHPPAEGPRVAGPIAVRDVAGAACRGHGARHAARRRLVPREPPTDPDRIRVSVRGGGTEPWPVQESMLAMRIRIGPNLSFGATCGPIDALRGDYDLPCYDPDPSYRPCATGREGNHGSMQGG